MVYYNRLQHKTYGSLRYKATLRNMWSQYNTLEENLARGPVVDVVLLDHNGTGGAGGTLEEALNSLISGLDARAERGLVLNFKLHQKETLWQKIKFQIKWHYFAIKYPGIWNSDSKPTADKKW